AKIGRSACAARTLSQRGSRFNCSRFLLRRSARNVARDKSPRRDHKSAGLDVEHPRKAIMTSTTPKKVRVPDLALMKQRGDRIVMLTAYDATMARLLDRAGIDLLLVGDSLGNVIMGLETTIPVTLDKWTIPVTLDKWNSRFLGSARNKRALKIRH